MTSRQRTGCPIPLKGSPTTRSGKQLSQLYCDTAIADTDSTLEPLLEMTGRSHIVFGTDYQAAGPSVIDSNLAALSKTRLLTSHVFDLTWPSTRRPRARVIAATEPLETANV